MAFLPSLRKAGAVMLMLPLIIGRRVSFSFVEGFCHRSLDGGSIRVQLSRRFYRSSTALHLNRFLFDTAELDTPEQQQQQQQILSNGSLPIDAQVVLPKDDYRTIHVAKILGLHNGDTVRAGIVSSDNHSGYLTDDAEIEWIPEGKVKKTEPLGNGNPPGSLRLQLRNLKPDVEQLAKPSVSLILALPRPLQLGRMLPMISQMGVDRLILTQAGKVPKDYFGSHLFRKPEAMREKLIEGLCQAGDVRLPDLQVVKNLNGLLNHQLDELFPLDEYARVIAHPQRADSDIVPIRMMQTRFPEQADGTSKPRKIVVAVGPEGGWVEPDELDTFQSLGFQQVTLGSRTLRSDCAVISLLGLAHEACANAK